MVVLSLHVCVKILYRGFNFFELHTGIDADGILGHFSMTFNAVGALAKKKKCVPESNIPPRGSKSYILASASRGLDNYQTLTNIKT